MEDVLKVAFLGYGTHMERSHSFPIDSIEYYGVFDPSDESAEKCARKFPKIKRYDTEDDVLNDKNIDAVLIGTPDDMHAESLYAAVSAGKHVFCEKPMWTSTRSGTGTQKGLVLIAVDSAVRTGLVVSSCHPRRTDEHFLHVKRIIDDPSRAKALGKVRSIYFDFSYTLPPKTRPWKLARGMLVDHGSHEFDMLEFLCGKSEYYASMLSDDPHSYSVVGKRSKDGIEFHFGGTRMLENRFFEEVLRVRFERGELTLRTSTGSVEVIYHGEDTEKQLLGPTDYEHKFGELMKNFVAAIKGEAPCIFSDEQLVRNNSFAVVSATH